MVQLQQFFDPATGIPQTVIIMLLVWQEKRLRGLEEKLNRLLGAENERRKH